MVKNYFKCEVSYLKEEETTGDQKVVSDVHLVEAVNYSDAETKIMTIAEMTIKSPVTIKKIEKFRVSDILDQNNDDQFWIAKTSFVMSTNKGVDKLAKETVLVNAPNAQDAIAKLVEFYNKPGVQVKTKVIGLTECPIKEIFNNESFLHLNKQAA